MENKWQLWSKDNLPEAGRMIIMEHKYGFKGASVYFYDKQARDHHIEWLEMLEQAPEEERKDFELRDPIVRWMYWPDSPNETDMIVEKYIDDMNKTAADKINEGCRKNFHEWYGENND